MELGQELWGMGLEIENIKTFCSPLPSTFLHLTKMFCRKVGKHTHWRVRTFSSITRPALKEVIRWWECIIEIKYKKSQKIAKTHGRMCTAQA